jgi:aminobenzoyl-glutamate transport protein
MSAAPGGATGGLLAGVEALGNRLPDPVTLFAVGTLLVMALSQLAAGCGWSVEKTALQEVRTPLLGGDGRALRDPVSGTPITVASIDPATGAPRREQVRVRVEPAGLLSAEGLRWFVAGLVANFRDFPPLAIVLVGMLGIGLAERSGFLPALLRASLVRAPPSMLTPLVVFAGVNSSLAVDAGYVVLPPVAATLYQAAGRSPLAGVAAAFAGVAAGFGANLAITGLDPLLAGLTEASARLLDPNYRVAATCNWWFMAASTPLLTAVGWAVTARFVEPRLARRPPDEGGPARSADSWAVRTALDPAERRGLGVGLAVLALVLGLAVAAAAVPGAPLHGSDGGVPRWVGAIVPLLFFALAAPGLAYGVAARTVRSDRDAARMLGEAMASLGPYVVLAFFAAQFTACFGHSRLGEMLGIAGGGWLVQAALPTGLLLVLFIATVSAADLAMASMSAKYAFLAPVFVPMFMQSGVSPELTQAAYRIGDSVTNAIAPLNPYLVIVLVLVQRFAPRAGIGTMLALMLPYALAFGASWTALLLAWVALDLPLGPAGPLHYGAGG